MLTYDYETECFQTLSNPRKTYVSPKECWFLPKHHQRQVVPIVTAVLLEAGINAEHVNDIFYTKGPRHLNCYGVAARMLSQMWGSDEKKCAIVPVNHGSGHIEMGQVATHNSAENDLLIDSKLHEKLSMIVEISMKLTFATRNINLLLSAIQDR